MPQVQTTLFGDEVKTEIPSYKGIYAMHKYWGKKPFNVISNFIIKNTQPGEVVLDPFCGSGVTIIEALKNNRRGISFDINPIAIRLTKVSLTPVSIHSLQAEFSSIKSDLEHTINSLYTSVCPNCGQEELTTHVIWENEDPIEVWCRCGCSKGKIVRTATSEDRIYALNPIIEPHWYPDFEMIQNSRINVSENQKVSDLFTPRALVGLSLIRERIDKISDTSIKSIMEVVLTGALSQASKLVFVIRNRKGKNDKGNNAEVGSWVAGYWVPEEHFEINVWNCFENRYSRVLKGIKEVNSIFSSPPIIRDSTAVGKDYDAILQLCSATKMDLGDNSVDYVFTDPPHVNRVLYMEMSFMWNSWLKETNLDWDDEIVISESKKRHKDSHNYVALLGQAISEISRVLKKGRVFSIAFNSLDDENWKSILDLCTQSGFILKDVIPLEYSATSVMQDNRKNALKTDFVLSFINTKMPAANIDMNTSVDEAEEAICAILPSKGMESYEIINKLMVDKIKIGFFFSPNTIIKALDQSSFFKYVEGKWFKNDSTPQ